MLANGVWGSPCSHRKDCRTYCRHGRTCRHASGRCAFVEVMTAMGKGPGVMSGEGRLSLVADAWGWVYDTSGYGAYGESWRSRCGMWGTKRVCGAVVRVMVQTAAVTARTVSLSSRSC